MSDITAWGTRSCADLGLVVSSPGERTHDQPWSVAVAHDIHEADGTDGRSGSRPTGSAPVTSPS